MKELFLVKCIFELQQNNNKKVHFFKSLTIINPSKIITLSCNSNTLRPQCLQSDIEENSKTNIIKCNANCYLE